MNILLQDNKLPFKKPKPNDDLFLKKLKSVIKINHKDIQMFVYYFKDAEDQHYQKVCSQINNRIEDFKKNNLKYCINIIAKDSQRSNFKFLDCFSIKNQFTIFKEECNVFFHLIDDDIYQLSFFEKTCFKSYEDSFVKIFETKFN